MAKKGDNIGFGTRTVHRGRGVEKYCCLSRKGFS